jgi:hypothetical protein
MDQKPILETRGIIIKEEWVKSLNSNILPNTLVLESTGILPGYFGKNVPDANKPRAVFIILDKKYDGLFLARKMQNISDLRQHNCYGAFGHLRVKNRTLNCIRIKNLDCFETVPQIQDELVRQGIGMMKFQEIDDTAMIHIHKSFLISLVAENIYMDLFEHDRYYLKISRSMVWEDFKHITGTVKNNIENSTFDAAMGAIWTINGLIYMIRIYDQKQDIRRLAQICEKYEAEIHRWNENQLFREDVEPGTA